MRWSESGADNMAKLIYTRENGMLDAVIEKSAEKIVMPVETETELQILSAAKVKSKVGTGNKWMALIQRGIPILNAANGAISNIMKNIIDGE